MDDIKLKPNILPLDIPYYDYSLSFTEIDRPRIKWSWRSKRIFKKLCRHVDKAINELFGNDKA